MRNHLHPFILTAFLLFLPAIEPAHSGARGWESARQTAARDTRTARAMLIEARNLAYDANFRNDQAGLRAAIRAMEPLVKEPAVEAYAHYYLAWTYWMLVASQIEEKNQPAALESAGHALAHARAGVMFRSRDAEFQTMLANALIATGILDRERFKELWAELAGVRKKALELGADNPRTVIMDAGMIYWAPPEQGGGPEKGVARWDEAARMLDAEAALTSVDPLAPRWGYALYYGWSANMYLRMTPPQKERARRAADAALAVRPDFWYVRERILPQLRE